MANIPVDICELIEKSFNQNIKKFTVTTEINKKGEGYLGEISYISLKNNKTNEEVNLVVKKVIRSDKGSLINFLSSLYANEIHFYSKLWPNLQHFQKSFPNSTSLEITPKCYGTSNEQGKEKIILENLKLKNYIVHPKQEPLSDVLFENIFQLYGKYHALSFAFKHLQPEQFFKLVEPLSNNWVTYSNVDMCTSGIKDSFNILKNILKENEDENILKKLRPYLDNGDRVFADSVQYSGPYSVILHGDCWSNNMMFKYSESKELADIKLLDFQMCMVGTPVYDLTYTFYSGAAKKTLQNWEKFLKVYHNSLSKSLKEYNLDAKEIYPFEELKKEWKNYSRFAFVISIMIWGAKFMKEEDSWDLNDIEGKEDGRSLPSGEEYHTALLNLFNFVYENNFL